MAWTAPATWSVSEVVVASKMNLHIRDNLSYLKASPQFDGTIGVGVAASASYVAYFKNGALPVRVEQSTSQINAIELRNTSNDAVNKWAFRIRDLAEGDFNIYDMTAALQRLYINASGNVGIGTTSPAGKLHVLGAGGVTTAGMAIGSVAAVTSIQTVFAAGTVSRICAFVIFDRNNTGGAGIVTFPVNAVALSNNLTYVNNDTITIAVTAGGAVTAQRTVGTNGTHDIIILAIFQ